MVDRIMLSQEEVATLNRFTTSGTHPAQLIRRARVLLLSDASKGKPRSETQIAEMLDITRQTVRNVKDDYRSRGLDGALSRKKRGTPPVPAKVDGEVEAHIIALSLTDPPDGYARWNVRLLADRSVELGYVESLSHMTVSRLLKKTNSSLT